MTGFWRGFFLKVNNKSHSTKKISCIVQKNQMVGKIKWPRVRKGQFLPICSNEIMQKGEGSKMSKNVIT